MTATKLRVGEMEPFVRYTHCFDIAQGTSFMDVLPYDCRLIYIADGAGVMRIGGREYPARRGSLFVWGPGVVYGYLPERDHPFRIYGVNFDFTCASAAVDYPVAPETSEHFDARKITERAEFTDFPPFCGVVHLENMQRCESRLMEIVGEYMVRKLFYAERIRGCFAALLFDVAREAASAEERGVTDDGRVDRILAYIQENYALPLSNAALGRVFSFHPSYVSRLIRRHTGLPLHRYLIRCRVSVALNLLQTTGLSVAEVAYAVGFSDANYFTRCFRRHVGVSPSRYQRPERLPKGE